MKKDRQDREGKYRTPGTQTDGQTDRKTDRRMEREQDRTPG